MLLLLVWYLLLAGFTLSKRGRYLKLTCFLKGCFCEAFGYPSPIGGESLTHSSLYVGDACFGSSSRFTPSTSPGNVATTPAKIWTQLQAIFSNRVSYSPTPALLHMYPYQVHGNSYASIALTNSQRTDCLVQPSFICIIRQQLASPSLTPQMSQMGVRLGSTITFNFQRYIPCSLSGPTESPLRILKGQVPHPYPYRVSQSPAHKLPLPRSLLPTKLSLLPTLYPDEGEGLKRQPTGS